MKGYAIYFLLNPADLQPRYVGLSKRPRARYSAHLAARGDYHNARWVRKLAGEGLRPVLKVCCIVSTLEEATRVEVALIDRLSLAGVPLTNATAGGEGATGYRHSPETRARLSASIAASMTPERRAINRVALTGRQYRPETIEKMRAAARVRRPHPQTAETRRRIGAASRLQVITPETRAKQSTSAKTRAARLDFTQRMLEAKARKNAAHLR